MENKYIEMANGINLNTIKGMKEYTKKLVDCGVDEWNIYNNYKLQCALEDMGLYTCTIKDTMRLLKGEKELIAKYGDIAKEYINVFDQCKELSISHSYFASWEKIYNNNTYVLEMDNSELKKFPTIYSISTFDGEYNCTIQLYNFRTYKEKFVHLTDFGVVGMKMITKLLKSKVDEELKYRDSMKWKGELDINAIVDMVKPLFPTLNISAREGKRGCDGNINNYMAIVVYDGKCQMGSMTLNLDNRGIACLTCRVPLCGESSCDVTNDNVINAIVDDIKFMIS